MEIASQCDGSLAWIEDVIYVGPTNEVDAIVAAYWQIYQRFPAKARQAKSALEWPRKAQPLGLVKTLADSQKLQLEGEICWSTMFGEAASSIARSGPLDLVARWIRTHGRLECGTTDDRNPSTSRGQAGHRQIPGEQDRIARCRALERKMAPSQNQRGNKKMIGRSKPRQQLIANWSCPSK